MLEIEIGQLGKFGQWREVVAFETKISLGLLEKDVENILQTMAIVGAVGIRLLICPGDDIGMISGSFSNQFTHQDSEQAVIPSKIIIKRPENVGKGKKIK